MPAPICVGDIRFQVHLPFDRDVRVYKAMVMLNGHLYQGTHMISGVEFCSTPQEHLPELEQMAFERAAQACADSVYEGLVNVLYDLED